MRGLCPNIAQVACIGFYVQMYFVYRLWVISKSYYVVVPLFAIFLFSLLSIAVAVCGRLFPGLTQSLTFSADVLHCPSGQPAHRDVV